VAACDTVAKNVDGIALKASHLIDFSTESVLSRRRLVPPVAGLRVRSGFAMIVACDCWSEGTRSRRRPGYDWASARQLCTPQNSLRLTEELFDSVARGGGPRCRVQRVCVRTHNTRCGSFPIRGSGVSGVTGTQGNYGLQSHQRLMDAFQELRLTGLCSASRTAHSACHPRFVSSCGASCGGFRQYTVEPVGVAGFEPATAVPQTGALKRRCTAPRTN
jgi:hypothetical protein